MWKMSTLNVLDWKLFKKEPTAVTFRGLALGTYTVTLKILSSLRALRTDKPKEPALGLK